MARLRWPMDMFGKKLKHKTMGIVPGGWEPVVIDDEDDDEEE